MVIFELDFLMNKEKGRKNNLKNEQIILIDKETLSLRGWSLLEPDFTQCIYLFVFSFSLKLVFFYFGFFSLKNMCKSFLVLFLLKNKAEYISGILIIVDIEKEIASVVDSFWYKKNVERKIKDDINSKTTKLEFLWFLCKGDFNNSEEKLRINEWWVLSWENDQYSSGWETTIRFLE